MNKQEKTKICPICGKLLAPSGYLTHIRLAHPGLEDRSIAKKEDNKMDKLEGLPIETQNIIKRIVELRELRKKVEESDDRDFWGKLFVDDDDTQEVVLRRIDTEIRILKEKLKEEDEDLRLKYGIEEQD